MIKDFSGFSNVDKELTLFDGRLDSMSELQNIIVKK